MQLSSRGEGFIAASEALYCYPYRDSKGVLTIGVGQTHFDSVKFSESTVWSVRQCLENFRASLQRYGGEVAASFKDCGQAAFDGWTSWHYNTGAARKGSCARLWNAGRRNESLAVLCQYVHAGGKRLGGLVNRREREARLIRDGVYGADLMLVYERKGAKPRTVSYATLLAQAESVVVIEPITRGYSVPPIVIKPVKADTKSLIVRIKELFGWSI
jgi:GH24 family phage-related lysozyme (muramidase)